jgi:tetratricopeptide (TPR) repeat protein
MSSPWAEKWLANQPEMQQLQQQFLEEALHFYQDFASETASDPDSRAERGKAYQRVAKISWMLGQRSPALEGYMHAIAAFQGLIEEFPDNPEYSYELGQCYFMRAVCRGEGALKQEIEDGRQAIALFEPLVSRYPADPRFREALAISLGNLSNPVIQFEPAQAEELRSRSTALLEKILKDFGPRAQTLRWLALAYQALGESQTTAGKLSEAEVYHRKAIETFHRVQINPSKGQVYGQQLSPYDWLNLGSCYRNLGNDLGRRGRYAEAQEGLKQALKIHAKLAEDFPDLVIYRPDIGIDHAALGALYQRMGHASEVDRAYQRARKELERQVQDFPTGWAYHYNLARFLVSCPQSRDRDALLAIRVARKALEAIPEDVHLWHVLGIGYFQLGEYRAALEALRKAKDLRVGGNSFDSYYLAMVQYRLGDREGACKSYREAVEWMRKNRPGDEDLCRLCVQAASLLGIKNRQTENREVTSEKE